MLGSGGIMQPKEEGKDMAIPNLKSVTLNIWGIRYISKDVDIRINSLINALNDPNSDYDIIALQEVWSLNDYLHIKGKVEERYPYAHYFQSGLVGSGCCVFSKHEIKDAFHHKFSLNGYPHKITHADWFAGKLVGLVTIKFHHLLVNVYTTHLHANYSQGFKSNQYNDEYLAHRMTQLYEMSQFIQITSHMSDISMLLGDLNTEEFEGGYKMLLKHADLKDAFKQSGQSLHGTCHVSQNCYQQSPSVKKAFPDGIRIDFILYKSRKGLGIKCVDYKHCFGKIPELSKIDLNYSDHEGVYAEFSLEPTENLLGHVESNIDNQILIESYEQVKSIISTSSDGVFQNQVTVLCMAVFLLLVILNSNDHYLGPILGLMKNLTLSLATVYLLAYALFIKTAERNHFEHTLNELDISIRACQFKQVNSDKLSKKID